MKKISKNLLRAIGIIFYFFVLDFAYTRMNLERLTKDIEVFSGVFLVLGILALEKAYKEDSGKTAITGIELLCLSLHSLSIMHIITLFKYDFRKYLIASSLVIALYYILKATIAYTKERREYLKGLSDISEIVKEDEPIKKEAKKRKTEKTTKEKKEPKEIKEKIVKKKKSEVKEKPVKNKKEEVKEKAVKNKKEETKEKTVKKNKKTKSKKEVKEND